MRERFTRWSLAAVLVAAALINGYLAVSEAVVWPVVLALLWVGLAAALLSAEAPVSAAPPAARRTTAPKPARV
ncbi:hypothetical protein ACFQV2_27955 [Actinokineospora soli]|uniref:Uncharacterized protein n=1 Tax=Actinokineospora soli TaxID=1048753 RepID=A0ABW2TV84_9PSEU